MAVVITSKIDKWSIENDRRLNIAILQTATRIHREAQDLAPVLSGHLRSSGRIVRNNRAKLGYSVVFGNAKVRYARRRHYENRKHPSTLKYLERAGDNNVRNLTKEIKRVVR